ncbi:hypothetical protein [uncultured Bifidobacterium sp.]|uniref:hypothetical protein n=1 Tax=uncultured Bifidobacterium sp. TaxID=165187 RepID=UPI002598AA2E|nr:hypothetical protein [uncultured Bifidobacterium sp.]
MFETFQTIINTGDYDLADLIQRIKTLYALGELTEEEMTQLLDSAAANANQDYMLPDISERVGALETRVAAVEERVGKLEAGGVELVEPEEPVDEWPEWVRPTSKDTQYHKGDKVTFNGQHYVCQKNNVSSSPDEDPKRWALAE